VDKVPINVVEACEVRVIDGIVPGLAIMVGRRGDGGELLRIEFARVINLEIDLRMIRFQDIFARHGGKLNWQTRKTATNKESLKPGKSFRSLFPAFFFY